ERRPTPRVTPMSLHSVTVHKTHRDNFASPPLPEPDPVYELVTARHRGRMMRFEGAYLRCGAHYGLNLLWENEKEEPGKYTWVEAYRRKEGDFILISRI